MLREAKFQNYGSLKEKDVTDNQKFWKTVKPIFSEIINAVQAINLIEENKVINDDHAIAKILNEQFVNIAGRLGTMQQDTHVPVEMTKSDPIEKY